MLGDNFGQFKSYYKNKTVLITGASGFIGTSITKILSNVPCRLILLSSRFESKSQPTNTVARVSFVKGDIRNYKIWDKILGTTDIIFHLAAQTSSKLANEDPILDVNTNLLPIINFIMCSRSYKKKPDIVFSGTVTQVGLTKKLPVNEFFPDNPVTVYDINKLAAEKYLQYYATQLDGRSVSLRLANVYGPGPKSIADRGILNTMIKRALRGERLTIYGKGNYVRDYIYIDDVANAFLLAGINLNKLSGNYYIISSGKGHKFTRAMKEIAHCVMLKTARPVKIEHIETPMKLSPIEFRNFIGDSSLFSNLTGWSPEISLTLGIKKTIDYYLNNKHL